MRVTDSTIQAPPFPRGARWLNVAPLRMDKQRGRPVLVEFWDFCRVNSLRTMPYLKAWHERYADDGLRVVGVHTGGFPPSRDDDEVERAVERLGIAYPVVLDTDLQLWNLYGNRGWPGRYLWDGNGELFSWHYGEGAYEEAELEIQELLGVTREPLAPVRPEDGPGRHLPAQSEDVPGPYSGPYEAGGVWAVLSGSGRIVVNGDAREISWPGCHELIDHGVHTEGVLELEIGDGVTCHATCFTPGVAPALGGPGRRAGG
jgi:thiol-disulfide isomerase/thioredoxin